jgi:hypothetical protein
MGKRLAMRGVRLETEGVGIVWLKVEGVRRGKDTKGRIETGLKI